MLDTYNLLYFEKGKSYTGFGAMPDILLHHWKPGIRDILENYPAPMSDTWIKYFMDIATVVASKSKDRTKVGCVLVSPTNKQILSTGFNGFCVPMDATRSSHCHLVIAVRNFSNKQELRMSSTWKIVLKRRLKKSKMTGGRSSRCLGIS